MRYKIINWFLLFIAISFVLNIIRTASNLSQEDGIIKEAKDRFQKTSDDNQNLKRQLAQVESSDFIEREARNKLNLGREGEIVLIMPSISPLMTPTPVPPDTSPNWQRWMRLFF